MSGFDQDTDDGVSFLGMAIAYGAGQNAVLLWNPEDSGVWLYVDGHHTRGVGADLRVTQFPFGTREMPIHITNCSLGGPAAKAQIWVSTNLNNLPTTPPIQDLWPGSDSSDKHYPYPRPIKVPPGWGVYVALADFNKPCVTNWQWREKPGAPTPPAPVLITEGSFTGTLSPTSNLDADLSSYASGPDASSFRVGRFGYQSSKVLKRIIIDSPVGRAFNGRAGGGTYSWQAFGTNDGINFVTLATGVKQYSGGAVSEQIDVSVAPGAAYFGHSIEVSDSNGLAGWRVASLKLFEQAI